jgi:hypothetical protein
MVISISCQQSEIPSRRNDKTAPQRDVAPYLRDDTLIRKKHQKKLPYCLRYVRFLHNNLTK